MLGRRPHHQGSSFFSTKSTCAGQGDSHGAPDFFVWDLSTSKGLSFDYARIGSTLNNLEQTPSWSLTSDSERHLPVRAQNVHLSNYITLNLTRCIRKLWEGCAELLPKWINSKSPEKCLLNTDIKSYQCCAYPSDISPTFMLSFHNEISTSSLMNRQR